MSITYEEALATLNSMFGPPWTPDTIDAVLRHHEGHMENTVESVLAHGDGDPQDLVRKLQNPEVPSNSGAGDNISMDEEIARQLAREGDGPKGRAPGTRQVNPAPTNSTNGASSERPKQPAKTGRGTPTQLPPDFLRIPGHSQGPSTIDEDEQLARMLQDELFTQELANNPEFAHLARGRRNVGASQRAARSSSTRPAQSGEQRDFGKEFMMGLSDLGENAKRRLQLIAANFNAKQNTNSPGGGLGGSSGRGERRGLLDSGAEEDVGFGRQDSEMEMQSIEPPSSTFGGFGLGSKKDK
mmetsp:Transcript_7880/g.10812  ORF Transcript_7880/g.10812 Transcript_7880/m.10812 type:complete len:298 (-) Transcript_7880:448-1341(-)|eukprot:CAMPEP_0185728494 /NCGR_PEP_ID=MMETSP1171-20130828/3808_1 /TAXON_ID=374046 /ORGANISM="Helicotheca tamensis, Strain CCMP826" /LENGTH=297 /DNA_ID=CAMNT_0028397209 /DNA_START=137 /DNA_END=1030 /DNA_ORIENTATION=-